MVAFKLVYQDKNIIRYEYYLENDKMGIAGVILLDIDKKIIEVLKPAEEDNMITIKAEELNSIRVSIDEMRKENGESPLTEEELPIAVEDSHYYLYASHAIKEIKKSLDRDEILQNGVVMWY